MLFVIAVLVGVVGGMASLLLLTEWLDTRLGDDVAAGLGSAPVGPAATAPVHDA